MSPLAGKKFFRIDGYFEPKNIERPLVEWTAVYYWPNMNLVS